MDYIKNVLFIGCTVILALYFIQLSHANEDVERCIEESQDFKCPIVIRGALGNRDAILKRPVRQDRLEAFCKCQAIPDNDLYTCLAYSRACEEIDF